jgi:hypothetical protein
MIALIARLPADHYAKSTPPVFAARYHSRRIRGIARDPAANQQFAAGAAISG